MAEKQIEADDNFEAVSSGAGDTFPQQCSALRKNGFVMIKDRPCKIVEMSTSKTGKHGHAKVHLTALDIFNNKKMEDICSSTHNMNVPNVSRTDYQFVDVDDDGFLSLLDDDGTPRDDLKLPNNEELKKEIKKKRDDGDEFYVTILKACGEEMPIAVKNMTS
jgi:translation initiation factor 5A